MPAGTAGTAGPPASVDVAEIVTWSAGLQFIMRAAARSELLRQRIRQLVQSQHERETQWWQGREALLSKQRSRSETKRQLDQVLYVTHYLDRRLV